MILKLSHQLATVYLIFGLQYVYTYTYTTRHVHRDTDLLVVHTANVFVFIFVLVQLYMYTLFTEIDDTSTRTCIIVISRRGTDPSCVSRSACLPARALPWARARVARARTRRAREAPRPARTRTRTRTPPPPCEASSAPRPADRRRRILAASSVARVLRPRLRGRSRCRSRRRCLRTTPPLDGPRRSSSPPRSPRTRTLRTLSSVPSRSAS